MVMVKGSTTFCDNLIANILLQDASFFTRGNMPLWGNLSTTRCVVRGRNVLVRVSFGGESCTVKIRVIRKV